MDAALRKEIAKLGRDRSSGASELTRRACVALDSWLRHVKKPQARELCEIAGVLMNAQPAMAPLLRLANELAVAADEGLTSRTLQAQLGSFSAIARNGNRKIAADFRRELTASGRKKAIVTYSRSATVLAAIEVARSHISQLVCSESRPGLEGRTLANDLRKKRDGMGVILTIDAALHLYLRHADALLLGADALEEDGFVNKIGTASLVAFAEQQHTPVWILADTTKLLPPELSHLREFRESEERAGTSSGEFSRNRGKTPAVSALFEKTPYTPAIRVLTEEGWFTRAGIAKRVRAIPVSSRMTRLAREAQLTTLICGT